VQCIVITPVCVSVGPPYYSQRAVFASPLSPFFIHVCDLQKSVKSVQNGMLLNDHEDSVWLCLASI